ncbi:hypothetical protein I316_07488 [Kwoniella heveanensis BCC8398]|uniref:alpha-L-rhamnosidase n=1 Tax=Kwoniella heveanensis BCC8398 TaxID=1296120 RepID=A0A1B9GIQ8_9TREE|nr:hypothetical protein I316_07488 [Kwoniella heveanensis BCC8398]
MTHTSLKASSTIAIAQISFEHAGVKGFVDTDRPRLSWRFEGDARDWQQISYDIKVARSSGSVEEFHVDSSKSNLVPWPSTIPLAPCEIAKISVKANGIGRQDTDWAHAQVEAALLTGSDWSAQMITAADLCLQSPLTQSAPQRPFYVYREFEIKRLDGIARLYATAFGMYDVTINGVPASDQVLKPGWTSYDHRLYYQVEDISSLLKVGRNRVMVAVGEGWYSGRIGFGGGKRWIYGEKNGVMMEIRVGKEVVISTDETWKWSCGPILASELYDGEVYDARLGIDDYVSEGSSVQLLDRPTASLILDKAPIKRTKEVPVKEIIISPSGKCILDFGQNLVGWVRINRGAKGKAPGDRIVLSHVEVLEEGEISTRPLRFAKCQDTIICGSDPHALDAWEPTFTYHGFRYVQVEGWGDDIDPSHFTAVIIHTDMERTGWFSSSHPMINRLHDNVLWSMRGNFVGLPTDCPQRDERLGWTGDLQVFCKTASFLFDTTSILSGWLQDLAAEQTQNDNVPPLVVPDTFKRQFNGEPDPAAIWGDVSVLSPLDLFESSGDSAILERQYSSMYDWLKKGIPRDADGLWGQRTPMDSQFGDWLDPYAPPDFPGDGRTDPYFVANAYLVYVTRKMAEVCHILGKQEEAAEFQAEWSRSITSFADRYITKAGRTVSDSQTALVLALQFDLLSSPSQREVAVGRLEELVRSNVFKIGTGFAGTPIILDVLANNDRLHLAYRMLQEKQCPSWLYCVSMGATTIWERWDSMRPDGSINPGEMTSFNHYALGAVASFMHSTIGGISPLAPGWKKIRIAPRPGGTVTWADVTHMSPYGLVRCAWRIENSKLHLSITVPPNTTAVIDVGDLQTAIGSGHRQFEVAYQADTRWPPKPIYKSMTIPLIDEIA